MAFPLSMSFDSSPARASASALRFTRRQDLRRRHNPHVDAAWWPRSSNLTAELGHLLQSAQGCGFEATFVAYRLDDAWTGPPGQFAFGARTVKVSGYHNHHQDMVTLVDSNSHERLQVLVVPPETPPIRARRALRMAAIHAGPTQGADLLALACGETRTAVVTG
jgi:hypothetical protein